MPELIGCRCPKDCLKTFNQNQFSQDENEIKNLNYSEGTELLKIKNKFSKKHLTVHIGFPIIKFRLEN